MGVSVERRKGIRWGLEGLGEANAFGVGKFFKIYISHLSYKFGIKYFFF